MGGGCVNPDASVSAGAGDKSKPVHLFDGLKQLITLRHKGHRYCPFPCDRAGSLLAHYLDDDFAALRQIQFHKEDSLPFSERQLAVDDGDHLAAAEGQVLAV